MTDSQESLVAGPIAMSAELCQLLKLRRALAALFPRDVDELEPAARDVTLSYVEEVERSIGTPLPFDVIALAVLRIPLFRRAAGLAVAQLGAVVRDCAGEFGPPRGWVAVASFGAGAMREDVALAQAGYDTLLAIARPGRVRAGDPDIRVVDAEGPSKPQKLSAFIRERLASRYGRREQWTEALRRAQSDSQPVEEICTPRVVDDRPPPPGAPERVVHPKFGAGTVVQALEGDKLEIAFDTAGPKILLRKFVRPL